MQELLNKTTQMKLLYVEDDDMARELMNMFLEDFFSHIDNAADGEEALEKFKKNEYDIIISDLNLPKINGLELFGKIRNIDKDVKIFVTTAHNDEELVEKCKNVGVNGFLIKPIDLEQFVQTLHSSLG